MEKLSGKKNNFKKIVTCSIILGVINLYYFISAVNLSGSQNFSLYWFLLIGLLAFSFIFVFTAVKDIYIFEPVFFAMVLYLCIFFVQPLEDLKNDKFSFAEGARKGTIFFFAGIIVFLIGYYINYNSQNRLTKNELFSKSIPEKDRSMVYYCALGVWIFSFFACLVYFLGSGYSLSYVLSIGLAGDAEVNPASNLLIFYTLKSCMTASWLYLFLFGKSKVIKIVTIIISIAFLMSLGGRTALFQFLLAPVFYHYAKNRSTPKVRTLVLFLVLGIAMSVIIQQFRYGVRDGSGFVMPEFTMETLLSPFEHEFGIYRAYYAVISAVPSKTPFLYGSGIFLYTLVMFIPRGLWPGKPDPPIDTIIETAMGKVSVEGGAVYPNIGEYYVEFGIIGVLALMLLFGIFLRLVNSLRLHGEEGSHAMILYAAVAPMVMQLVTRGYTASNFPQLVLTAAPVFVVYYITKRSVNNNG